jgi:hypothetical protein
MEDRSREGYSGTRRLALLGVAVIVAVLAFDLLSMSFDQWRRNSGGGYFRTGRGDALNDVAKLFMFSSLSDMILIAAGLGAVGLGLRPKGAAIVAAGGVTCMVIYYLAGRGLILHPPLGKLMLVVLGGALVVPFVIGVSDHSGRRSGP